MVAGLVLCLNWLSNMVLFSLNELVSLALDKLEEPRLGSLDLTRLACRKFGLCLFNETNSNGLPNLKGTLESLLI